MFDRNKDSGSEAPKESKPVWQMDDQERRVEQMARIRTFAEFFRGKGAHVRVADETLIVETPKNIYHVDVASYEPRFVKIEVVYEIVPGDLDRASWACYNAQALSYGAKAKALPLDNGYQLSFTAETVAPTVEAFTDVADILMVTVEDCREAFIKLSKQVIEADDVAWALQPKR